MRNSQSYIGFSQNCERKCVEANKSEFQQTHRARNHFCMEMSKFNSTAMQFINRYKSKWTDAQKKITTFFEDLKKQIQIVEKFVSERISELTISTSISSENLKLLDICKKILNKKVQNLTCEEIDLFLRHQKKQGQKSNIAAVNSELEYFLKKSYQKLESALQDSFEACKKNINKFQIKQVIRDKHRDEYKRQSEQLREDKPRAENRNVPREQRAPREQKAPRQQRAPREQRATREQRVPPRDERFNRNVNRRDQRERDVRQEVKEERNQYKPQEKKKNINDEETTNKNMLKIKDITATSKEFSTKGKVQEVLKQQGDRIFVKISDHTGSKKLILLKRQVGYVNLGDQVHGTNLEVQIFHGEIQIRGSHGSYFTITRHQQANKDYRGDTNQRQNRQNRDNRDNREDRNRPDNRRDNRGGYRDDRNERRQNQNGVERRDREYDRRPDRGERKPQQVRRENNKIEDYRKETDDQRQRRRDERGRGQPRGGRGRRDPRERGPRKPELQISRIQKITPNSQGLILIAKIFEVAVQKNNKLLCLIADRTAAVYAIFPSSNPIIKQGASIYIKNISPQVRNQHIIMVADEETIIELARTEVRDINEDKNISKLVYEEVDEDEEEPSSQK